MISADDAVRSAGSAARQDSLVVAVLTYRRPAEISAALPLLVQQAESVSIAASILVIDNDPARSAEGIARGYEGRGVRYVCEPTPGIAAARSRALREAGRASLLAFIDDDEVPSERWLSHLLAVQRTTGAAAVVGPVISQYPQPPDPWIAAGEFFRRRRLPTGTQIDVAATNNLLLDLAVVRRLGLDFDVRLGLRGGEDTLFTRRLAARGGLMVWCDEAIVFDQVPAERLTRRWVVRRAFSSGNAWSRISIELAESRLHALTIRARLVGSGALRLAGGLAKAAAGVGTRSIARQAKGVRTAARGMGMISGAFDLTYREYRRP